MDREWTEQDLHTFVRNAQAVFEEVSLTPAQPGTGWQDEGLQVDYELRGGRVDCELCRDDLSHDFLTGVYNRRYLETVFAEVLAECAAQGRSAAVALVMLDDGQKLRDSYGQPVMDQLHCFVANQWRKSFDTPEKRVVCRLTGSVFVVGCLDVTASQLAQEMQVLYNAMPRECITTTGMMRRIQYTLSCAAAGMEDGCTGWKDLYEICDRRLRTLQAAGGDAVSCAG